MTTPEAADLLNSEKISWFLALTEIGNTGDTRPRFIDTALCVSPERKASIDQGAGFIFATPASGDALRMRK